MHRRTDPSCINFTGYPEYRQLLRRWWFDRGRGKSCHVCFPKP